MKNKDIKVKGQLNSVRLVSDSMSDEEFVNSISSDSPLLRHLAESRREYELGNYQTIEELAIELGIDLEAEDSEEFIQNMDSLALAAIEEDQTGLTIDLDDALSDRVE